MGNHTMDTEFDVVIMGAGFAGICQARHLLLNVPSIQVALVDPHPAQRGEHDMKVGESMSETAALFINKELGLHDYMIEQHAPKQGLNFHWPKGYDKTDSLDDYFHVWVNREGHISNFHVNLSKFERDVLAMTCELGAVYIQGHVLDVDLTGGDAVKTVAVQSDAGACFELKAKHVVDAAGRRFIIGKQKDNVLFGPQNLRGGDNGSAWVRVRNVDRTVFHDSFDSDSTATSRYYCTNHWFGHGHWLWQVPSWDQEMELSVGVVHHHEAIPAESLNSREKFYNFLKENHNLLYRLVTSGEAVDFAYSPCMAHRSKEMFSPDNWYVIGDAACFFDAFYSHDTTAIALAVESVTEIIRTKLQGDADAEIKRKIFNDFTLAFARSANVLMADHAKHLGHASAMSWRVFYEYMWWFGLHVPMYAGKWHLDPGFLKAYLKNADTLYAPGALFDNVYETLNEVVDKELNIGLMDVCRMDQLGSYTALNYHNDFNHHIKTEPKKCNVFLEWKWMALYMAWWYARLQWKVRGVSGVIAPKNSRWFLSLLRMASVAAMGDLIHRIKMFGKPKNTVAARTIKESLAYRRQPVLQPWGDHLVMSAEASEPSDAPSTVGISARSSV